MSSNFLQLAGLNVLLCTLALLPASAQSTPEISTQILKWKDGKKAAFLLAFDDGAPSQLKNVVPELERRKLVGTFYLVTGNKLWEGYKGKWEAASKSPAVVVANHTFTHTGATSVEQLDTELQKNNEVLWELHPEQKLPRLLAFGKPGGVPWTISKEDLQTLLTKNNLVDRPGFWGPPIHQKSAEECLATIDKAITKGEMGHLDMHGVGGDWLPTPLEWFTAILDKLEASRNDVWVTDAASWHKYEQERKGSEVKTMEANGQKIRLTLVNKLDPALYDEPLTLRSKVPADWKECVVAQGDSKATQAVVEGAVQYNARPGLEITLEGK